MASSICATVVLLAELAGLPSGKCALICEVKRTDGIFVEVQGGFGWTMAEDGSWFRSHQTADRRYMVLESLPEQCASGGAGRWGGK